MQGSALRPPPHREIGISTFCCSELVIRRPAQPVRLTATAFLSDLVGELHLLAELPELL